MKLTIQELFDLIDVCDTAGRQSAIDTVAESTIPDGYVLVKSNLHWVIPSELVFTVANRLGVSEDDLVAAFAEVDNT